MPRRERASSNLLLASTQLIIPSGYLSSLQIREFSEWPVMRAGRQDCFPSKSYILCPQGPIYIVSEWFQVTVLHRPFQILQCLQCEKTEISAWIKHSLNECSKRGSRDLYSYSWFHLSSSELHDLKVTPVLSTATGLCALWAAGMVFGTCKIVVFTGQSSLPQICVWAVVLQNVVAKGCWGLKRHWKFG